MDYLKIKLTVLDSFKYEEETIFHVENYLKSNMIQIERYTVISILSELLKEGLIELFDDPSTGQVKFENCSDNYVEDYWFVLTDKGYNELSMHKAR